MYEEIRDNGKRVWKIVYTECCKHKWTAEEHKKNKDGKWKRTGRFVRADSLEEIRALCV